MGKFRKFIGFECKYSKYSNILAKCFFQNFDTKKNEEIKYK